MKKTSLVYRHISIYRFIMNILYLGKYRSRFAPVIDLIRGLPRGTRILELCFGDTVIAAFCKNEGYFWKGLDINQHFVSEAIRLGYDAETADLMQRATFQQAEVCVMTGSFYHFFPQGKTMLKKMLDAAPLVVLSEPVINLSSAKGLLGFLARKSANAGKGNEEFRYNKNTLLAELRKSCETMNAEIVSVHDCGKDLIVKIKKNA
jgi:hypothetical protein